MQNYFAHRPNYFSDNSARSVSAAVVQRSCA